MPASEYNHNGNAEDTGNDVLKAVPILCESVSFMLLKALEKAQKEAEKLCHDATGGLLTPREVYILYVAASGPYSQKQVANFLGINNNVMVGMVDELEHKKVIVRERNRENRREYVLTLTSKGRQLVEKMMDDLRHKPSVVVGRNLPAPTRKALLRLLARFIQE